VRGGAFSGSSRSALDRRFRWTELDHLIRQHEKGDRALIESDIRRWTADDETARAGHLRDAFLDVVAFEAMWTRPPARRSCEENPLSGEPSPVGSSSR